MQRDLLTAAAPAIALRPYQHEAVRAVKAAHERGETRPLVSMATGLGKTLVFSAVAKDYGHPTLILAHRDELLQQAADKLRQVDPGVAVGLVKAGENQVWAEVVVASVQTLARQKRLDAMPRHFKLVVVDEAHHAQADSYRRIMAHFDGLPMMGVTATPETRGGGGLGGVWGELVYDMGVLDGIRGGYLCDIRGLQVRLRGMEFGRLRVSRGDFQDGQAGQMLHDVSAPGYAAKAYLEHARGRKAIVFTPTVELAHEMAETFRRVGVPAEAVDGGTARGERRAIIKRFRAGETRVVANAMVLTEGFDEPSVGCIIVARPTLSRPLFVQMIGRGTRTHPGKQDCLVIDLVGATGRLNLMTVANLFGVPAGARLSVAQQLEVQARQAREERATRTRLAEIESQAVDLFTSRKFNWVQTGGRYVLSTGGGFVVLTGTDGRWNVVHDVTENGKRMTATLAEGLDLGYAQGAAEDFVRRQGAAILNRRDAGWRKTYASPKQIATLRKWGLIDHTELLHGTTVAFLRGEEGPLSKGEASDLITERIARRRVAA